MNSKAPGTPPSLTFAGVPRIPESPPQILPIASTISRPLWSVMIPAYNCSQYLRHTLESVLEQAPDADIMQIEVIDDASTDADVEALVASIGKGRIGYYRQPQNVGSLRNFETCINRAKGHWVHLLHGDDLVKKGFYKEIENLFNTYPEAGAAFTNHFSLNEKGDEFEFRQPLSKEAGILPNFLARIAEINIIQPPSIVVKRSVYEHLGSFFAVHFGEDWEMWTRIAAHYQMAYSPKRLASYRSHSNNITANYFVSGQSVKDIKKVIGIIQKHLPVDKKARLKKVAMKKFSNYFAYAAHDIYIKHKNPRVAIDMINRAIKMDQNPYNLYLKMKLYFKMALNWLR